MPENLNTVYMYIMLCNALWILVAAARLSSRTAALKVVLAIVPVFASRRPEIDYYSESVNHSQKFTYF
jgi:hypothetical protein